MNPLLLSAALAFAAAVQTQAPLFSLPEGWTNQPCPATSAGSAELCAKREEVTVLGLRLAKPTTFLADKESYLDGMVKGARGPMPDFAEVQRDFLTISGVQCARLAGDFSKNGERHRSISYVMPAGDQTALLLFSGSRDALRGRDREAYFENIARQTHGLAENSKQLGMHYGYKLGLFLRYATLAVAAFFAIRFFWRRRRAGVTGA
jgi:hypothetical protein